MSEHYDDLDRPPLRGAALRRVLDGSRFGALEVVASTGSTMVDVAARARAGAPEGLVVVAEEQTAGRGRLDRTWASPARGGLWLSALLRPSAPRTRWPWLGLLAGVAVATVVRDVAGIPAVRLKWPNDVLVGDPPAKAAGLLAEVVDGGPGRPPAVVLGIGIDVTTRPDELPGGTGTSLRAAGATSTDREPLLRGLLRGLSVRFAQWEAAAGDPFESGLGEEYRGWCGTLGTAVEILRPGDADPLRGTAEAVDDGGRLVVRVEGGGRTAVSVGDVRHVRLAAPGST